MKNYRREHPETALCGLNCIFCPIHNMKDCCPGCGGGEGHQSCPKVRCAVERNVKEFCFECGDFPCEKYDGAGEWDSFITYRNIFENMERIKIYGIDEYKRTLYEKKAILDRLLADYNDGRKKTLFCTAANLFDAETYASVFAEILENTDENMSLKERAAKAAEKINNAAKEMGISLKLRRKKATR